MIIRDEQGKGVVLAPQMGGMQGDCTMPEQFIETYEKGLEELIKWSENNLGTTIHTTNREGEIIEIGTSSYADDANETNRIWDEEHAGEVLDQSTNKLNQIMNLKGLGETYRQS